MEKIVYALHSVLPDSWQEEGSFPYAEERIRSGVQDR
jgi:hypothetical protein